MPIPSFSPKTIFYAASAITALMGGLVIIGWQFDIEALIHIAPGLAAANILILVGLLWWTTRILQRIDREHRQAEEEKDLFFTLSLDMLCIMGFDGYLKRLNPTWGKTLGMTKEDLLARSYIEFVHPEDRDATLAEAQKLAGGATTLSFQNRFLCGDGSYKWLFWQAVPVLDQQLIYATARDITEHKQIEETLRIYTTKLEWNNRELQDFAYVASHDLQEPLRKIQAFGDRLKHKYDAALGDEGSDYLERMQNAAGRMQVLINDLLAYSRITTKAQPFVPVDLARVGREVVADLETRIEQTGGRVEIGQLPVLNADPMQMRQLLQNLLGNALKFHQSNQAPVVKIYGQALPAQDYQPAGDSQNREWYQIFVEDNGIGFDEKYLNRIFTPFQRLHGRNVFEGTGIGLAICRKIAERHGGNITARSTPDQGATFIITLPNQQSHGVNSQ